MKFKFFTLHFLVFCGWALLVTRLFQLQVLPNERLEAKINGQFASKITVNSKRGDIFDRGGNLLATSVPSWSVFIDPQLVIKKDKLVDQVSAILNIKRKTIYRKLSKRNRFVWVKRKISNREYLKIIKLNIRGLSFLEEYKRVYFNEDSLGFLVGKVDIDGRGLSGLELQYNKLLMGKPLRFKTLHDGRGRPLVFSNDNLLQESRGEDIHLNIDVETQVYLAKKLRERLVVTKAKRAWGVIMSPNTGEIVASVQVSGKGVRGGRNNIAVSEIHEPGSILKTFSFTRAASEAEIKPSAKYSCGDKGFLIGRRKIKNSHKEDCKKMSLMKAFSRSLNTVSAELALGLGEKKLVNHYLDLGFGEKTGVDFPGEASPIFHKKLSGKHHLAAISFGHGISLTPLQVIRAYSAFSNDGYLVKPHYLKGHTVGRGFEPYKQEAQRKIYSKKDLFLAKGFLSSVLSPEGTGQAAVVPGYLIGGKTGTSQKADLENGGYRKEVLSSFVGVYPLSKPKYIALIMIDEPISPRSGGSAAGPVFSKVAEFMLTKDMVLPDKINKSNIRSLAAMGLDKLFQKKDGREEISEGRVPNLKGYSLREAVQMIKGSDVVFKINGSGKIKSISPAPGKPLPESKILSVVLK